MVWLKWAMLGFILGAAGALVAQLVLNGTFELGLSLPMGVSGAILGLAVKYQQGQANRRPGGQQG